MSGPRPETAADLYEKLRDQGLSHEAAVQQVMAETQHANASAPPPPDQPTISPSHGGITPTPYGWDKAVAQGLSFGTGDEIGAAITSARDPHTSYQQALEQYRAGQTAFRRDHPVVNTVAELGGAALSAPMVALRGVKGALAAGALAGAGGAEGGVRERLAGAGLGAAAGGAFGAAIPAAARIMTGGADVLGTRGAEGAARRADELLLQSLQRDETSPGKIRALLQTLQGGKPETIADIAGENTRGLARAAQATPGKAKQGFVQAFEERQANQPTRIAADLERGMGLTRQDTGQLVEDLITQRADHAKPLYEKAYAHGAVNDPRIEEILKLPWFKEARVRAARLASLEGKTLSPTTDVQTLDYLKRGLDDFLAAAPGKEGGLGPTERGAVRKVKNELLQRLDAVVPDYKAARAQYAGDSALRDAVESGREVLKADPRVVAKEFAALSPSEQQMYRLGALDAVRRRMDATKDGRDLTKVIFGDSETRARLEALFPSKRAVTAFTQDMEREATMAHTKAHVMGGSPTARIQAELADMGGVDPGMVAQAATGNIGGAAISGIAGAIGRRARGVTGEVADQLATRFQAGTKNRGDLDQLLQVLESVETAGAKRAANQGTAGRALATEAGLTASGLSQTPTVSHETVPPAQKKRPDESPDEYALRLKRGGVPEAQTRLYFAAQGLGR